MSLIRLLIVDDHPVVRDGLRGMFLNAADLEVVAEAADGEEALVLAESLQPDIILMDLHMPRVDGISAIKQLSERGIPARVLVLTTYDMERDVMPAIEAGAAGYLLKDTPRDELLRAVRSVANGEVILSPSIASRLVDQLRSPAKSDLTERELEILGLVAKGTTNREIARMLFISEATVKTHLLHIYEKLGARDRAAAVGEAYRRGLL
jgi:DNA-binding NarL/FixJ family response regulator